MGGGVEPAGNLASQLAPSFLLVLGHTALGRGRVCRRGQIIRHGATTTEIVETGAESGAGALLATPPYLPPDGAGALPGAATRVTGAAATMSRGWKRDDRRVVQG